MCFHAQQSRSVAEVHQRFTTQGPVATGVYNGFSHPKMTVITAEETQTTALHHWGLIPHWAKDNSIAKQNAAATVSKRPTGKPPSKAFFSRCKPQQQTADALSYRRATVSMNGSGKTPRDVKNKST